MLRGKIEGLQRVLVIRRRRTNLLLFQERNIGLLLRKGFRDRIATIRAKARSGLLASQGKGHVSIATSLDT